MNDFGLQNILLRHILEKLKNKVVKKAILA